LHQLPHEAQHHQSIESGLVPSGSLSVNSAIRFLMISEIA